MTYLCNIILNKIFKQPLPLDDKNNIPIFYYGRTANVWVKLTVIFINKYIENNVYEKYLKHERLILLIFFFY